MRRDRPTSSFLAGCALWLLLGGCHRDPDGGQRTGHRPAPKVVSTPPETAPLPPPTPPPARPRWVLFGGGADPVSNPVSLAQDLDALAGLLPGPGVLLFASGAHAPMAVERPEDERPDDVRSVLAELLAPAGHAALEYQPAPFTVHGPATRARVLATLRMALHAHEDDLLLYFAGHGEQGESPADNRVLLWGGTDLRAFELAELLDVEAPQRVRLVNTACFGGGFSDFMFRAGRAPEPPRHGVRCGLFAAPWDDEASGCDPNPDRRAHESYALHFVEALQHPERVQDLDDDGTIGLLDAHTHARVQAQSFDVPTTTSERFVRLWAPSPANPSGGLGRARNWLPEEAHVVDTLGAELKLPDETSAWQRVEALEAQMERLDAELQVVEQHADGTYYDLRIALLERWPVVDHPYRPDFDLLVKTEGAAILELARDSDLALAYARARQALAPLAQRFDRLRVQRARALRVARAFETLRLTQALLEEGTPKTQRLASIRACERAAP